MKILSYLLIACMIGLSTQGLCDDVGSSAGCLTTGEYVFVADQSVVTQTGGIAGIERTYGIEGRFVLRVNAEAGTASFVQVDANLVPETAFWPQTLDEVFNLIELTGTVVDKTSIRFAGKADDGSDVVVMLAFKDNCVHLTGETIPPPNSADFFVFTLEAVACRDDSHPPTCPKSGPYVFAADHSTVTRTGGIAGIPKVYMVEGRFCLRIACEAGTASFAQVDANLVDPTGLEPDRNLDEVFNLTGLAGTILDDASIRFTGRVDNGSDVVISLIFEDSCVRLTGETIPPPDSADFFVFGLDAVACRECPCPPDRPRSGRYAFAADQSTVTRTGGIAGIPKVYAVKGRFRLRVARGAGTASFVRVDANLVDPAGLEANRSLDEVFNLTSLVGTIGDDASVLFTGTADDGSDVVVTLIFKGRRVCLTGETIPPPDSADFFTFALDAVARRR